MANASALLGGAGGGSNEAIMRQVCIISNISVTPGAALLILSCRPCRRVRRG